LGSACVHSDMLYKKRKRKREETEGGTFSRPSLFLLFLSSSLPL